MSDRGEYRSIPVVLINGKDFRRLPERARWIFVLLKMNLGAAGIDVLYPDELLARLVGQSGASENQVRLALDCLEHADWIRRHDNVIWVVGQLDHSPNIRVSDVKHRKAIQRHVAGLPRHELVRRFVMEHEAWFMVSDDPAEGFGWVIEGPSKALPSTSHSPSPNQNPNQALGAASRAAGAAPVVPVAPPPPPAPDPDEPPAEHWLFRASAVWEARFGAASFPWGKAGKAWMRLKNHYTPEVIAQHLETRLAALSLDDERFPTQVIQSFADTFGSWAPADPDFTLPDGADPHAIIAAATGGRAA